MKIFTASVLMIGGFNWGLIGLFQFNLVGAIFGDVSILSRFIYTLVGLSAVYQAFTYSWGRKHVSDHRQHIKKAA